MRQIILIVILTLSFTLSKAQELTPKKQKIGLVLSGGGAKGFAHIGVLKVIDSLGVKIDYIAGTSMGAVIGSLYASGYSGKQLDSIFKKVNFDDLIKDNIPREAKTTYERENSEKYVVTLPFDNFKIKLPSALSRGQNTFDLLTRLMLPNCNETNFSKLPIPFFCIATNVENGTQVLLDSGNLPQVVQASSALPSLFQPVLINNQLLIDGGVVNNYPIDELKAKGMDVIIGVDVQDGLANRTDLSSAPEILFQINNFRTINDMKIKSKKTDIYIKPDITKYNLVSFSDGVKIIAEGEKAALLQKEVLLKLRSLKTVNNFRIQKLPNNLNIKNIVISGKENYTTSYIRSKLKLEQNSKISFKKFNKGTNNLIATNNFDSFFYEFKNNDEGYDLYVNTVESKQKTLLRLAIHYDGLYDTALLLNLTKKQLIFKNDIASLDLIFGDNIRYNFNYFIDKGVYWSVGLNSRYNEFKYSIEAQNLLNDTQLVTTNVNKLNIKYSDLSNQFFVQTQFRKDFPLRLGIEHKKLEVNTETIISNIFQTKTTFEKSNIFGAFGQINFDTLDNSFFPNKGVLFNAKANYYAFSSDYNNNFSPFSIYSASLSYAVTPINKLSFKLSSSAGFTINAENNQSLSFVLGGYGNNFINNFKSFYGYDYLSLGADSYIMGNIDLDYEIFEKNHVVVSANYANVEDDLFKSSNWLSIPSYTGYAFGYGYDSILGPIEVKYTYSPDQRSHYWFFNLGYWF
jgi:NTE family protein